MSSLSVLEQRILLRLPSEFHEPVMEEIDRFRMESERMSREENKIGQATLTDREISRLNTTTNTGMTV